MQLKVCSASRDDVYKDIARINLADRSGIQEGVICKVAVGDRSRNLVIRGLSGRRAEITLDEYTRERLGVEVGEAYDFAVVRVGWVGQVLWALRAADPGVRVATVFALIGTFMGLVGLLLPIAQCSQVPAINQAEVVGSSGTLK